jgi:hypothetical protein
MKGLIETGLKGVEWINLAHSGVQWRAVLNTTLGSIT